MRNITFLIVAVMLLEAAGCASRARNIPGTQIPDTETNRDIIELLERYRLAVESKDTAALLLMASRGYWEDGGTPTGGDDYGYDGLREVLNNRFQRASDIRYSLRYVNIQRRCKQNAKPAEGNQECRAYVDVIIDASFSLVDAQGQVVRPDMRDQNQLVLEWDIEGERWLFLSGM